MNFTERIVSGTMDFMCAVVGVILVSGYFIFKEKRSDAEQAFLILLGLVILDGLCMGVACMIPGYAWAVIPGNLCNDLMPLAYTFYIIYKIREKEPVSNSLLYVVTPASLAAVVIHGISVWSGNILIPAEDGFPMLNYASSEGIVIILIIILDMATLVRHSRTLGAERCILLLSITILPLLVPFLMSRVTDAHVRLPVITLMLLMVYVRVHVLDQRRMAEQEKELTQTRMDLMISQIRPHFLYNALSVIYYLCERDPKTAQQAVGDFTAFLRNNLEAMEHEQQRPFSNELDALKRYLSLESLRYGKRLQVEYDIQAEDFLIPVLSVQPLVENAVKHGIGPKRGGGTIRIRSMETEQGYVVEVEDDGVGYDPTDAKKEEHTGIGLKNVSERLQITCGGTLVVRRLSENGGTCARILLPRARSAQQKLYMNRGGNRHGTGKMEETAGGI